MSGGTEELLDEPRDQHYIFAHHAIRKFCQDDPIRFFDLIDSDEQRDYLEWIWSSVEGHLDEAETGLSLENVEVTVCQIRDCSAVVIKMPEPLAVGEAYAVGIVLTGEGLGFRYFTLECGLKYLGGSSVVKRTVLCEWSGSAHLNYGDGPLPTVEEFLKAIELSIGQ